MAEVFLVLAIILYIAMIVAVLRVAWLSRSRRRTTRHPLASPARAKPRPANAPRRPVGRPGAVTVAPQACALWLQRGWRNEGKTLRGAFRTRWGSCSGEISLDRRGYARDYFIISPPQALLDGSHGPCFRARGGGRYWVHFNHDGHGDIDAGIVAIERLLNQALGA
jgi:hypothetical protein